MNRYKVPPGVGAIFSVLVIAGIVAAAAYSGLREAIDVPLSQGDGAYQTASGLHRLAAGDHPGADFYPYLGVGLLYFLYPVFAALGGTMAASVFAAFFLVYLATTFSIGLTAALLARSNRTAIGILAAGLFSCLVVLLHPALPVDIVERMFPGNSLRPMRSFIPYLAAVLMFLAMRSAASLPVKALLLGMVSGTSFLWSNDFGIPAAGIFGLVGMGWVWLQQRTPIWLPFIVPVTALTMAALLLTVGTAGSPLAMFQYNLGVSHDQSWYFPCWAQECRIFSLSELFWKFLWPAVGWWLLVYPGLVLVAAARRSLSLSLLAAIGTVLFAGAVLSAVAGHLDYGYASAFRFWSKTIAVLVLPILLLEWLSRRGHRWSLITTPAIALATLAVVVIPARQYQHALDERKTAPSAFFYSDELGGYVPAEWRPYIERGRTLKGADIVEDYWGIWSAVTHTAGPYPTDSVIHALGPARAEFIAALEHRPAFVVTGAPLYLDYWSGWLMSSSWWFYEPLLRGYRPTMTSRGTQVWEPAQPRTWPAVGCRVAEGSEPAFILDAQQPGYYEVTLHYDGSELAGRTLLHVQNNLNYAVDAEGHVSIDPRAEQWTFPVAIVRPGDNRFGFRLTTRSDTLDMLRLGGCSAREIITDADHMLPPLSATPKNTPFDLTDARWRNGVHRQIPSFFVENSSANRDKLAIGKQIRFYDGRTEHVLRQLENGPYLEIQLTGAYPLHGGLGFPREFEILEP